MTSKNSVSPQSNPSPAELDDLMVSALSGELTAEEMAYLEALRKTDPSIEQLYQKTLMIHQLLVKEAHSWTPDSGFEDRIFFRVQQKLQPPQPEAVLESLYYYCRSFLRQKLNPFTVSFMGMGLVFVAVVLLSPVVKARFGNLTQGPVFKDTPELGKAESSEEINSSRVVDSNKAGKARNQEAADKRKEAVSYFGNNRSIDVDAKAPVLAGSVPIDAGNGLVPDESKAKDFDVGGRLVSRSTTNHTPTDSSSISSATTIDLPLAQVPTPASPSASGQLSTSSPVVQFSLHNSAAGEKAMDNDSGVSRKLIRNASLNLEIINYAETSDKISALAKAALGYIDSTNCERGGNGKLQGTIVVKVAPEKLDDFLLVLRGLGTVHNQAISTEDVTKNYYDIQARLTNAQKTEEQLQDLLQKNNGKVSELLAVERELNRVRGDIESMQGQLKLYDFQVQLATVTICMHEKDLNQAASYLLKENDSLSLNTDDVETTYQGARRAVEDQKGQILQAEINRSSPMQISATVEASIPADHIDAFFTVLRGLGRVDGLQRHSARVAQDGGNSATPTSDAITEKDSVHVLVNINLDFGGQDQVGLTVVTKNVDDVFDRAKKLAAENKGTLIASNLSKDQSGTSLATLQIRVPGAAYQPMMDLFRSSGRIPFFSRNDSNSTAAIAQAGTSPVLLQVSITDDEPAIQTSEMSVVTDDVQTKVESLKKILPDFNASLKSSTYQQDVNGSTKADLVIKLPLKDYPKMDASLKSLGRLKSSSVHREERPRPIVMGGSSSNPSGLDEMAPAEIHMTLYSQPDIVPQDSGVWATTRNAFSTSATALGSSIVAVVVILAASLPWIILLVVLAWLSRQLYVSWRK